MFAQRHMHLEWEILKWLAIISLASALAIAFASHIAVGDEPRLLPPEIETWSQPMGDHEPSALAREDDAAAQVWNALDDQQAGRLDRAIEAWPCLPLAADAEIWRHIALAQAYLGADDLEAAAEALEVAGEIEPSAPLVHYYLGILRLEQADKAQSWYDAQGPQKIRLVSYPPVQISPNSREMYRLAAMTELDQAIELAGNVQLDQLLVSPDWPTAMALRPAASDLLLALGADGFEFKAHNMLSYLHLDNGSAEQAESHMDAAAAGGMVVVYGYEDLGELYEQRGRHLDAFRAYAKAAGQGIGIVRPTGKMLENLQKAFLEP